MALLDRGAGVAQHRDEFGGSYTLRGNATRIDALGSPSVCRKFDTLGNLVSQVNSAGQTLDVSWSSGSAYALPSLIRPNGNTALERTMQYNALFDMTRVTAPNTAPNTVEQDFAYDTSHRPTSGEMETGAAVAE